MPICDRPDLRMHLRYKSIPGLLLNKALMSELANHCAYCHSAIAARSIRRHYKDVHPQLLQYEPLHRAQVYGFAQLGSGKDQCILCDQASHNVQSHQCGVLFQLSVMLGQTYDVSHFPVMPVMLRTLPEDRPEDDRSTSRLTRTSTTQDEKQKASPSDSRQSSTSCSQTGHRGSTSLHKCTRCQMAFLSAIGLTQHMQESHDASSSAQTTTPSAQVSKKLKTSRTIQQMLGLPPAGPIPEAPKQFECPLCLETIGRKALIGHLRREHQVVHTGAFSFVPDQDMIQGSLTCRHCYSTFTMEQALIIHFKRGSCPVLICQWAQTQHFGTTIVVESDRNNPVDDHPLSALLHRYFDLSQAGREHDSMSCPAFELAYLWFPMLYTPCWTPLQGLTWFRHTADWLSHFPEMPHTTFVIDQAFAMIRVLGHQPPIAWAWALDTESIPHQRWHAVPIHETTHEQLQVIKQILGHLTQILAQNDLHQLAHPPDDGSATDRRRSILPGLADCMPRRLQAATTRDIVHRPSEEWPRATKKELDIIHEYIRQQGWGPDPDAEPIGPSAGGHPEPAWTRSEPDDLSSMWQGLIDAIPARTGQAVAHSAPSRGNDNFTPTDNVPSSVHRTDHSGQQVEPDGKRRRTGSWPQGQRNPDRGSEMAVPVLEPGS